MRQVEHKVLTGIVNAMLVGWIDAAKQYAQQDTTKAVLEFMQRYNIDEDDYSSEYLRTLYYRWKNETR
jgi:hypothetical protein